MRILVTGATGFVGSNLISELLKNKSNQIIATSRNEKKAKKFDWYERVIYIEYDIGLNKERKNLYDTFCQPDILIHLAWSGLPNYDNLIHIEKNLYSNYFFIKNLISNGLRKISITGTCFEYGMVCGQLNEDMGTHPENAYALAKDTLRKFIIALNKEFEFSYKWIRLFYLYGAGQSEKSLISLLDKAINNGDKDFDMSGGEQLRDFLPIDKAVKNIALISMQDDDTNQVINCCSGKPISVRNLVEKTLKEKGCDMKLNLGVYAYPDYEPMAFWGSNKKLLQIKKGTE